jgi:hypothetical protein
MDGKTTKTLLIFCGAMLLIFIFSFILPSCKTCESAIIIRDIPIVDVSDDMTVHEYMQATSAAIIDYRAYILDLIVQIQANHKYIDLRKK